MKTINYFGLFTILLMVSCNNNETKNTETEEHEHTEHADHTEVLPGSAQAANLEGKKVYFISPLENANVSMKFKVVFGVEGMDIKPAGELAENTGHHHLIIDGTAVELGQMVPADSTHIHFGKGQTETEIELKPGAHTLTLQFADGYHQSYGEKMSSTIKVFVK